MQFQIRISHVRRWYTLQVELLLLDKTKEQFRVTRGSQMLVLESNRPFFRNRGIMHRPPIWRLIGGQSRNMDLREKIQRAILEKMEA